MQIGGADGFPLVLPLAPAAYTGFTLQLKGPGTLHFDEFKAWTNPLGTWPRNVAYKQPTSASSVWKETTAAECGVDGKISGDLGYHGTKETDPWWRVDIAEGNEINYLTLFNRVRFHAQRMRRLQIVGHTASGEDAVLFNQQSPASLALVAGSQLRNIRVRLTQQIGCRATDWQIAAFPETAATSLAQTTALQLLDEIAARLEHHLHGAGNASTAWQAEVEIGLRSLLPTRIGLAEGQELAFDVRPFTNLHLRSGLKAVTENRFGVEFLKADLSGEPTGQAQHFDALSAATGLRQSWPVDGDVFCVSGAVAPNESRHWELWGEDEFGRQYLVYDSIAVTRTVGQLQWLVGEIGRYTFSGFTTMAAALEAQNQCEEAFWLAKYYPAEAPQPPELKAYLAGVERRSRMDPTRLAVSRTKHGYKNTFRFKDKAKQLQGLKIIIERLAELGLIAVPAYGTLLGMLREGDLIDHDDDLDVVVLAGCTDMESMMQWRDQLTEQLEDETDWKVYRGNLPGKNVPVGLHVGGEYVHCDLFPSFHDGDNIHVLHENLGGLQPIDAAFFEGERTVVIGEIEFTIPDASEKLLEWWYGDWRTPNPGYRLAFAWERKPNPRPKPKSPRPNAGAASKTKPARDQVV